MINIRTLLYCFISILVVAIAYAFFPIAPPYIQSKRERAFESCKSYVLSTILNPNETQFDETVYDFEQLTQHTWQVQVFLLTKDASDVPVHASFKCNLLETDKGLQLLSLGQV